MTSLSRLARRRGAARLSARLAIVAVLFLASPTQAHAGSNVQTITVVDNDPTPVLTFGASSQSLTEGDSGSTPLSATVNLSAASGRTVTVPYTVGGTASNPSDHNAGSGSLTFTPGNTSATISFSAYGDTQVEPNETIVFTLGVPTNATVGSPGTHTVTIVADDDATPDPFSFATQYDVPAGTTIYSETKVITGYYVPTTISVTGGYYSINGGAYTNAAGTISPGQSVRLKHNSGFASYAQRTTTLTVGGVSGTFTSITEDLCDPQCD